MKIPDVFFLQTIEEKQVFFFTEKSIIGIPNHRHICLTKIDGKCLIFACCTSQEQTLNKFLEFKKLPSSSVVYIPESDYSFLTKDTFINCNDVQIIDEKDFINDYNNGNIRRVGEIKFSHFAQIVKGVKESKLIPTETKKNIPDIN